MSSIKFRRQSNNKPYRKIFAIATEGSVTEPQYFSMLDDDRIHVKIVRGKFNKTRKSSPSAVLQRMKDYLKKEKPRKGDQHWLVIDKDAWKDDQIRPLYEWALEANNRGFALSNPKFEYWLLLHFEDAKGVHSAKEVLERLNKYINNYLSTRQNGKVRSRIRSQKGLQNKEFTDIKLM